MAAPLRHAAEGGAHRLAARADQRDWRAGQQDTKGEGGLEDEPIGENARKHISDARLRECGATEAEIEVLHDRRVELNALSTEQLVELVEGALPSTASRR